MRALARYAMLKSLRDDFLLPIFLGPVVLIGAAMIGMMVQALILHHQAFPFEVFPGSAGGDRLFLPYIASMLACGSAGAASFWLFRDEVAHHSIAAFVLAANPVMIIGAVVAYAAVCATTSFVLSYGLISLLCDGGVPFLAPLACTVAGAIMAGSIGIAIVARYPDPGVTLPVVILSIIAGGVVGLTRQSPTILATLFLVSVTAIISAAVLMERRCAG